MKFIEIYLVLKESSQLSPCYSRSATSTAEVDIDIGPGFQDSADTDANANFDDVQNTASDLTDRIREDNLPKDMGFAPTEAIVKIQPRLNITSRAYVVKSSILGI